MGARATSSWRWRPASGVAPEPETRRSKSPAGQDRAAALAPRAGRNRGSQCARPLRPRTQAYSRAIGRHPSLRNSSLRASLSRDWTVRSWRTPSMRSWPWTAWGKLPPILTLPGPRFLKGRGGAGDSASLSPVRLAAATRVTSYPAGRPPRGCLLREELILPEGLTRQKNALRELDLWPGDQVHPYQIRRLNCTSGQRSLVRGLRYSCSILDSRSSPKTARP